MLLKLLDGIFSERFFKNKNDDKIKNVKNVRKRGGSKKLNFFTSVCKIKGSLIRNHPLRCYVVNDDT